MEYIENEYTIEINNHYINVLLVCDYSWDYDPMYGCDIDGNRGVERCSLAIENIKICDSNMIDITERIRLRYKYIFSEIESYLEELIISEN